MKMMQTFLIWASLLSVGLTQQTSDKGPPRAEVETFSEKVQLGQNVKLTCPILGDPMTIYEWYKDGEKIDHTWLDYVTRSNNKVLKIKASKLDDTGIFVCRGVNGFGKASVNIQLIVVDPQGSGRNEFLAPSFTSETKVAPLHYFRKIGETLSVTCEAFGNPIPEIVWLKNGHKVSSGVKYIHAGKSALDLVVLDGSDGGFYSCMARNAIGSVTQNYSLEVSGLNPLSSHGPLVVVTGISPVNSSIIQGQSAKLTCSVRSQDIPHIKWLKQISKNTPILTNQENILNVRDDRYKILPTAKDIKINQGEYINILTLENVDLQDNGTYFCFVTKNGLNSLTFKSATVFVMPKPIREKPSENLVEALPENHISLTMMLIIICLSVISVFLLIIVATWYIRNMRSPKTNSSHTGTSESSLPESPDEHHFTHLKSYEQRPNFVYGGHHQLWGGQVYPSQQQYPLLQHHQLWSSTQPTQPQKVTFRSASHHEMLDDNQYEVPFGHLMPRQVPYQIGSMNSMQDHFTSSTVSTPFLPQSFLPRSNSMRPPQFYHHVDT